MRLIDRIVRRVGFQDQLKYLQSHSTRIGRRDYMDNRQMRMLFAFVLHEGSNCVDVGAHTGSILREIQRYAPRGRHYAFEPIPDLYAHLCREFPTVTVRQEALSSTSGSATFKYVRNAPAYSGLLYRTYPVAPDIENITVQLACLDDILPPDYSPDLIKVDVEGAEHLVLAGAERVIGRCRPIVVFEHGLGGEASPGEVHTFFARINFRIFDLDGNGPYDRMAFLHEYELNKRWNWVAHS